jgi:hypothetical protein
MRVVFLIALFSMLLVVPTLTKSHGGAALCVFPGPNFVYSIRTIKCTIAAVCLLAIYAIKLCFLGAFWKYGARGAFSALARDTSVCCATLLLPLHEVAW